MPVWKVTYVTSRYNNPLYLNFYAENFKQAVANAWTAIELVTGIQDFDITALEKERG